MWSFYSRVDLRVFSGIFHFPNDWKPINLCNAVIFGNSIPRSSINCFILPSLSFLKNIRTGSSPVRNRIDFNYIPKLHSRLYKLAMEMYFCKGSTGVTTISFSFWIPPICFKFILNISRVRGGMFDFFSNSTKSPVRSHLYFWYLLGCFSRFRFNKCDYGRGRNWPCEGLARGDCMREFNRLHLFHMTHSIISMATCQL